MILILWRREKKVDMSRMKWRRQTDKVAWLVDSWYLAWANCMQWKKHDKVPIFQLLTDERLVICISWSCFFLNKDLLFAFLILSFLPQLCCTVIFFVSISFRHLSQCFFDNFFFGFFLGALTEKLERGGGSWTRFKTCFYSVLCNPHLVVIFVYVFWVCR